MRTSASFLRILGFLAITIFLMEWIYDKGDEWAMTTEPMFWVIVTVLLFFAIVIEVCVEALNSVLYKSLKPEAKEKYNEKVAQEKASQFKWIKEKYKESLDSRAITEENEIILDHNYDGIKELDNNLPPWWVYMFYATIIFAAVYLVRFEIFNDYNQDEEYQIAVAEARIEIEEWKKTAKDLVDVNSVTLLADASDLKAGQAIFTNNCVVCHKADGGGGIGPNLTDAHWILGGGIKNVFNTISEGGRDGKGMVSWKNDLKPLEMAQVSSYLLGFQGTTPAEPKAAEGEIWIDPDMPETEELPIEQTQDSTSVKEASQVMAEIPLVKN